MERTKWKSHFLISKLPVKLQESKQCGTSIQTDNIQMDRTESLETHTHTHDQIISDKVSRPFNEKRTIFSTNGARKTGYQYGK